MKNITIIVLLIIVLLFGGYLFFKNANQSANPSPTPTYPMNPSNNITYCSPNDLKANLTVDAAAGNIYGTFTIKNISSKTCQVVGSNYISAQYDKQIKNIATNHMGAVENTLFQLSPGQTLYSQDHYPNGPQCSSGIQTAKVLFTYAISPSEMITFNNESGNKEQEITTCVSPSEVTTIDIWNISSKPITP